jgi:hypothetical protein
LNKELPTTVAFWYKVPVPVATAYAASSLSDWVESCFMSPDRERAFEVQRQHWDNLKALGYHLSARP